MRQPISKRLVFNYLSARARAKRYIRDSSPPLTKRGLAQLLKLEASAFTKFVNGTVFVDEAGEPLSTAELKQRDVVYLRAKWTDKRLNRFIERVETECWKLGISHTCPPEQRGTHEFEVTDTDRLRISKARQYLHDIRDASNLAIPSALALWNVCAQEAHDARDHIRPTMGIQALHALAAILDRKDEGQLCILSGLSAKTHAQRFELSVSSVQELMRAVLEITGDPCEHPPETNFYDCYHKAHGYGGYCLFFLGVALLAPQHQETGVQHLLNSISTNHLPTQTGKSGHIVNTATAIEFAASRENPAATLWASNFKHRLEKRAAVLPADPAFQRLAGMNIPHLRPMLGGERFLQNLLAVTTAN